MAEAQFVKAFILGIVSAFSLLLGAAASFFWRPSDRVVAFLMALGGGALLAALTLDLVGEALERGNLFSLCLGCLLGGVIFIVLDLIVSDFGGFKRKAATTMYHMRGQKHRLHRQILSGIGQTDIFKHLQNRHFKQLSDSIKSHHFKKGEYIYHPGDPAEEMHIALSGEVNIFYPEKDRRRARTVLANQAFGLRAFFTGAPHVTGAAVMSDTVVLKVPRHAYNGLLMNSTTMQQLMHRWLRDDNLLNYLRDDHRLAEKEAKKWLDGAVQSLINKGRIPPAVTPRRESDAFSEIIKSIDRLPIFQALPANELSALAGRLIYTRYEKGKTLFHQGDLADRMFIINRGEVSLIDGQKPLRQAQQLVPRDCLGFPALIFGARHSVSAIATQDVEVWALRISDVEELLRSTNMFKENVTAFLRGELACTHLKESLGIDDDKAQRFIFNLTKAIEKGQILPKATALSQNHGGHEGAAIAIWLGILLDGIPESLVIGSSLLHSQVSLSLLVGLFIANFPEALSSSFGMRSQGFSRIRILFMWASIVLITGIGAALGNMFFTGAEPFMFALTEGVAAGAMLTMIAQTMLPEAYFKGGSIVGFATLLGFLAAIGSKAL